MLSHVVLEETLESPLDNKEIKPANSKGNQLWIPTGRNDAEVEASILWPLDEKSQFIRKKPWCWERLKAEEGADRGWEGWIASPIQWNELGHTLGDSEGQGGLVSCSSWCCTVRHYWTTTTVLYQDYLLLSSPPPCTGCRVCLTLSLSFLGWTIGMMGGVETS